MSKPKTRRESKYEEIVEAAAVAFAANGFSDTTIQDVAREIGITGAAIYYYFDSKDQLLYEIWKRAGQQLKKSIDQIRAGDGTPLEKLHRVFHAHLNIIMSDRSIFEVLILQRSRLPEYGRDDLINDERQYQEDIAALIAALPEDQLRVNEPGILALSVLAQLNGVIRWYSPSQRLKLSEIADIYFDIFTRGALIDPK